MPLTNQTEWVRCREPASVKCCGQSVHRANTEKRAMSIAAASTLTPAQWDQVSINTICFLSVDAVKPQWFNRDRFVLSAGHGSMLLYSLLYLTDYRLPLEQIKRFRQWGSITPGRPERSLTSGVETATGSLGQGFGAGATIAEAYLSARQQLTRFEIINHFDLSRPRIGQAFRERWSHNGTHCTTCMPWLPANLVQRLFRSPNFERIDAKDTFYTGRETK